MYYGILSGGSISLYQIGKMITFLPFEELELPPLPATWPANWNSPQDPKDDTTPQDPSEPPAKQVCEAGYTWSGSPTRLDFSMPFGGPAPASQFWYYKAEGWRPNKVIGVYNADPAWMASFDTCAWIWYSGPCFGTLAKQMRIEVDGKDAAGEWLQADQAFRKQIDFNDGASLYVDVVLDIKFPVIQILGDSSIDCSKTDEQTVTYNPIVKNNGDATSILRWKATISGSIAPYASLDISSGTLASGAEETLTLTLSNAAPIGSYSGTILVEYDGTSPVVYQDIPMTMAVSASVPSSCPYPVPLGSAPNIKSGAVWSGLTGNETLVATASCKWEYKNQSRTQVYLWTAAPSGTVKIARWNPSLNFQNIAWSTVMSGVSFPCWVQLLWGENVIEHLIIVGNKQSGQTPAGSYSENYRNEGDGVLSGATIGAVTIL